MTDQLGDELYDLEDRLLRVLTLVLRAQHGEPDALSQLYSYTVYGEGIDPFIFLPISPSVSEAIREQSLRCPSAPGSEQ